MRFRGDREHEVTGVPSRPDGVGHPGEGAAIVPDAVLLRDAEGRALAVACRCCGAFALDTAQALCARCSFDAALRELVGDPRRV